jgi:hypothetical protein
MIRLLEKCHYQRSESTTFFHDSSIFCFIPSGKDILAGELQKIMNIMNKQNEEIEK